MEKIVCSAILFPSKNKKDVNGIVLCGLRHSDIINQYYALKSERVPADCVQGFLTTKNRFVDRVEAYHMHFGMYGELFSEDLY